jgi:uncharacterized protein (TIGR03000 family)
MRLVVCITLAALGLNADPIAAQVTPPRSIYPTTAPQPTHPYGDYPRYYQSDYPGYGRSDYPGYPLHRAAPSGSLLDPFTAYGLPNYNVAPMGPRTPTPAPIMPPVGVVSKPVSVIANPVSVIANPVVANPVDTAILRIVLPDPLAEVRLEGQPTTATGRERTFTTPRLEAGFRYAYTVVASWTQDGRMMRETRIVPVTPGQTSVVDFTRPQ